MAGMSTDENATDRTPTGFVLRHTDAEEGRFAYREESEPPIDPPLVLIHGLGMSSRSFEPLLPELARGYHVLAPDLPGCGQTPRHTRIEGIPELVDAVVAWMDSVGLDRVDMLGHSLGGQVLLRLAARHPDRVRRAVLVACPPDPSAPYAWQKAIRLLVDGVNEPAAVIRYAAADYLRATPWRMWGALKKALRADAEAVARDVRVPTLVVRGEKDPVVTQAWSEKLTDLIPGARLEVIEGGTHGLPGQSPDQLGRVVRAFLAKPD